MRVRTDTRAPRQHLGVPEPAPPRRAWSAPPESVLPPHREPLRPIPTPAARLQQAGNHSQARGGLTSGHRTKRSAAAGFLRHTLGDMGTASAPGSSGLTVQAQAVRFRGEVALAETVDGRTQKEMHVFQPLPPDLAA